MNPLPIDPLLPQITAALEESASLVLRADPGAGKTTRVPSALLDAGLAAGKQVVVLEPRRIAARAAAEFVARERGEKVGETVGYRVRFEQCGGERTKLWFVTEGVLGRQLTRDPFLEPVGVLVLDEFHERHLQGDVALAVARELQESVRPDLKIVVMSATLATRQLAEYLGGCPLLDSPGRAYPVAIEYERETDDRPLTTRVVSAVRRLLHCSPSPLVGEGAGGEGVRSPSDILVFLPGAAEILRVQEALDPVAGECGVDVVSLHGDLPLDAQARAIRRGPRRKVVLSTNVAETALTIEGVTTVIDCGVARTASYDTRHGINRLRLQPISRAAAEQRAGRAGRLAAGSCIRLWTESEQHQRRPFEVPEILRLDLTATLLELRAWGMRDAESFRWLDPPRESALRRAERLLVQLGAVDATSGEPTAIGRRMLEIAVEPRLARMLLEAERLDCREEGVLFAALASERDILLERRGLDRSVTARHGAGVSDLQLRADLFRQAAAQGFDRSTCSALGVDVRTVRSVDRTRRQLQRAASAASERIRRESNAALRCLLAGYPDRVCRRRSPGSQRAVMVGGIGVVLDPASVVRDHELFVAVEVDAGAGGERAEARVRLASAIEESWLSELFPGSSNVATSLVFDPDRQRVVRRVRRRYVDLTLEERIELDADPLEAGDVLAAALLADANVMGGIRAEQSVLLARIRFLGVSFPEAEWRGAREILREAVEEACAGKTTVADFRDADLGAFIRGRLTSAQRLMLDREAPTHLILPSGRSVPIVYDPEQGPMVSARIQEVFGLQATPRLASGRVPLTIELLAPSQRPVQVTRDLASFWRNTYADVRKQLRGRYPRHPWPEDPLAAAPTSRAKPRS